MLRYLVALDGSENAPEVLRAAVALAKQTNATLVLYRAVGMPVDIPGWYRDMPAELEPRLRRHAREELEALAREAPGDLVAGLRVEVGVPWDAICRAARDEAADLVVIGAHGYHLLDRLLGTTAARVVNHADRPVLVVRPTAATERPAARA